MHWFKNLGWKKIRQTLKRKLYIQLCTCIRNLSELCGSLRVCVRLVDVHSQSSLSLHLKLAKHTNSDLIQVEWDILWNVTFNFASPRLNRFHCLAVLPNLIRDGASQTLEKFIRGFFFVWKIRKDQDGVISGDSDERGNDQQLTCNQFRTEFVVERIRLTTLWLRSKFWLKYFFVTYCKNKFGIWCLVLFLLLSYRNVHIFVCIHSPARHS